MILAVDAGVQLGVQRLADGVHNVAELSQCAVVEYVAPVKHKGRFDHVLLDLGIVQGLELVPLSGNRQRVRAQRRLVRRVAKRHVLLHFRLVQLGHRRQIHPNLVGLHLGVVDAHRRALLNQPPADFNRRRLARVARVLLNAKPSSAIRLPVTVLKSPWMMRDTNRSFCRSFIVTTEWK
eukprot:TRINITY_DN266_c0_g1_i17.p1 TRINITY_DN266_c0_g1~~TRINITY_DN266_c0_g1_i17.p1  ORF type:complete len:179 (-),score=1.87 TRINITY_DN266_c0_g1_i17:55-591(-)